MRAITCGRSRIVASSHSRASDSRAASVDRSPATRASAARTSFAVNAARGAVASGTAIPSSRQRFVIAGWSPKKG
jgi:hypothetical protein